MSNDVPTEHFANLITSVPAIADETSDLAERQTLAMQTVASLIDADAGFWAWGRGWPDQDAISPLAIIDFGLTDKQRTYVIECSLDRDADIGFRTRVVGRVRRDSMATSLHDDLFTKAEWDAMPFMRRQRQQSGIGSWLHSVFLA